MIASALDMAAAWSTIGTFVVVIIGGLAYAAGVVRPLRADARWRATKDATLGPVVLVETTLTSRTRNTQTIQAAALVKDPGWPRRWHRHQPDAKPFASSSGGAGAQTVAGHGALEFNGEYLGTALPYGATRLWMQVGRRNFYFKLRED